MRRASILLLVAAMSAMPCACLAQAHARAQGMTADAGAGAETRPALAASPASPRASRSPFGQVMAVMIRALQHQERAQGTAAAPVRTTAAGTPMDIQVGANFRDALEARPRAAGTGTGGATAAPAPRVAPPEELALRQATLAGPG